MSAPRPPSRDEHVCIPQQLLKLLERSTSELISLPASALDAVIDRSLAELGSLYGADRVYLFQTSRDILTFSNTHEWCAPGVEAQREHLQDLPSDFLPWWAAEMRAGRAVVLPSLDALPPQAQQERALLEQQQIRSLLALPMLWQEHFWGFVGFDHVTAPRSWSDDEVAVMHLVASAFAQGLQRRQLDARLSLAGTVLQHAQEGIFATDAAQRLIDANPMFCRITGWDVDAALGQALGNLFPEAAEAAVWNAIEQGGAWRGELAHRRPDGGARTLRMTLSAVREAAGRLTGFVGVFADISQLREQELRLQQLAFHDPLTQLPNRTLLADRMQQALARARRSGQSLALCLLDLDRFKPINDLHGHAAGDRVLVEAAKRLQGAVRDNDSVARLGGDEFVLLLPDLGEAGECEGILQRVQAVLAEPCTLGEGTQVQLSACIGVRTTPPLPEDADTLLRQADQALYAAKREGPSRIHRFDADDERDALRRQAQQSEVVQALARGEMRLHYQPIIDLRTGRTHRAEALVRWLRNGQTLLPPGEWLPLIEHTPRIAELGRWVLRAALTACAGWQQRHPGLGVSINVSPYELCSGQYADTLAEALAEWPALPRDCLQLELTEGAPLANPPAALDTMHACRQQGVRFALDDFGTGYSSLSTLKSLPLAAAKLDRSFMATLGQSAADRRFVQGIVDLVAACGMEATAEGIETDAQAQAVQAVGCWLGQGYGILPPVDEGRLLAWLSSRTLS